MYIVIETFGGADCAYIVVDENTLSNKVFDSYSEAQYEAMDCQAGVVFGINAINASDISDYLRRYRDFIRENNLPDDSDYITVEDLVSFVENEIQD